MLYNPIYLILFSMEYKQGLNINISLKRIGPFFWLLTYYDYKIMKSRCIPKYTIQMWIRL